MAYAVLEHDIPESLVLNLDQSPLSYVSPENINSVSKMSQ